MKISVSDIEKFFASRPGTQKYQEEIIRSARLAEDSQGAIPSESVMQIMGIFADQFIEDLIAARLMKMNEEQGVF